MSINFHLQTPVLFLVFNKFDTTKRVFNEIQKAKPEKFFIASDGPRKIIPAEKEIVKDIRNYIIDNINWNCEYKTLFRTNNLGCKYAVSNAIDWFFRHVEQGIILEDDCLPNQRFFRFCQELLEKYENNEKIISISGSNILSSYNSSGSYFFSKNFNCWGWATWRKSWNKLDINFEKYKEIKNKGEFKKYYTSIIERKIIEKKINATINTKLSSWAIPWSVTHRLNNSLSIIPKLNLIENIGFSDEFATHTKENIWDEKILTHKSQEILFPLKHPDKIEDNKGFSRKVLIHDVLRILLKKMTLLIEYILNLFSRT